MHQVNTKNDVKNQNNVTISNVLYPKRMCSSCGTAVLCITLWFIELFAKPYSYIVRPEYRKLLLYYTIMHFQINNIFNQRYKKRHLLNL